MDIPLIRDTLKTISEGVTGLRAYDTEPERVEGPAVIWTPSDPYTTYHEAMARGLAEVHFEGVILVSTAAGFDRAFSAVDVLLSSGSEVTGSLVDALEAATYDTYGTPPVYVADHAVVEQAHRLGLLTPGGKLQSSGTYATGQISLVVRAKRK